MEQCRSFEQNALLASDEEMRSFESVFYPNDFIVCPRPLRVGISSLSSLQPVRCHMDHRSEPCNSEAGLELLDLILKKEYSAVEPHDASEIASSPPFFSGSPPTRADNPLIQDARFKYEGSNSSTAFSSASLSGLPASPSLSVHNGCIRRQIGAQPPAAVWIEGFDILGRGSTNSCIPAAVRVEGFDIRNGEHTNSSIPAAIRVGGLNILSRDRRNSSVSAAA